ncbi:MAG TPA: ABC transporter permease [Gemmatimonadaceae bacterium]|nr:ABC transporter permease [Gemmatimonadaceae bacterium]
MSRTRPTLKDRARAWSRRLRSLLRPRATEREADAELAFHLEMETEKYRRAGLTPDAARRAALLAFGGVNQTAEALRDVQRLAWIDDTIRDLKYSARTLRRAPAFTAAVVATLALTVGSATGVFAVVHAIVIAPLPYAQPERLIRIWEENRAQSVTHGPVSPGTFVALRARAHSLDHIALYGERDAVASVEDDHDHWAVHEAGATPSLFDVLEVHPILGSGFPPEPALDGQNQLQNSVVISYELWQRAFGGRPDVVGRTLKVDDAWSYRVRGVMPPGFAFPNGTDVWTPMSYAHSLSPVERQFRYYGSVARVRNTAPVERAERELAAIEAQLAAEYPASNAGWSLQTAPLDRAILGDNRPMLLALFGLAVCVLLIGCANVTTLVLARARARAHELAVRIALGADRRKLMRHSITDGLLLASLGGLAGIAAGYGTTHLLVAFAPSKLPRLSEVRFAGSALAFALLATTGVTLLVGVAPLARAGLDHAHSVMRSRTSAIGGGRPYRAALVAAQVALALMLTVAAALLVRSFERLRGTDLGFDRRNVYTAQLRVSVGRFPGARPWFLRVAYYDHLVSEVSRLPGVTGVGVTTLLPLTGDAHSGGMWRTDAPGAHGRKPPTSAADQWKAAFQAVTPGYFKTLNIPVVRGRSFDDTDRFTQDELTNPSVPRPVGVAIINQAMASRYFPGQDPLGKTIFLFDDQTFAAYRTIVGIVRNARGESVDKAPAPTVFIPFAQNPGIGGSLVLSSSLPASRFIPAVMKALKAADPAITIASVRPLQSAVTESLSPRRFLMLLVGGFAVLALLLSSVGVFGMVGYIVRSQTHEIGIRIALGARASQVIRLVVAEAFRSVGVGLAVGAVAAVGVGRGIQSLLYATSPVDLLSLGAAAAAIIVSAALATVLPAKHALGVDPIRSLRNE